MTGESANFDERRSLMLTFLAAFSHYSLSQAFYNCKLTINISRMTCDRICS